MTTDGPRRYVSLIFDPRDYESERMSRADALLDAVRVWAAAAGIAGAYVPESLLRLVLNGRPTELTCDLIMRATEHAHNRWVEEGSIAPPPRGLSVRFSAGRLDSVDWITSGVTSLRPSRTDHAFIVCVEDHPERGRVAIRAAAAWCEGDRQAARHRAQAGSDAWDSATASTQHLG